MLKEQYYQEDSVETGNIIREEVQEGADQKKQNLAGESVAIDDRRLNRIYRKVDKRLIPCLWTIYFFTYSAKSTIGIALTMNISKGHSLSQVLNLSSQQISIGITLFYISCCLFEIPCNMMLAYISPRFWISKTLILVGIVLAFYSYIDSLIEFYVLRFLLGVSQAGLWPGMAYYLMLYYPPNVIGKRIGWYFSASQISTIMIGFFSIGFQKMDGILNLEGYKWMFLVYGIVSIILGIFFMWMLPQTLTEASVTEEELNSPSFLIRTYKRIKKSTEVSFLTHEEKQILLSNISVKDFLGFRDILLVIRSPKIWPLILMYFGGMVVGISIHNYGALIIHSIDVKMSEFKISFLYSIVWIINLIGVITILPISDHYNLRLSLFIICCVVIIFGMLILTFSYNKWVRYLGLLITISTAGPTVPICMAWCAQIFRSETKISAAIFSSTLSSLGQLGSIFATCVLYEGMPTKDAYKKSNYVVCGIMGMSIMASLVEKMLLKYFKKLQNTPSCKKPIE
ncbi:hypothetical protein PORY_000965 [Pneumocystis oryctolagi]|uniref:Uncharacterized protein n=1 Tax=Pneumocystis oryctolagi TaxID=42067 RepID=A0ACB7CCD8_9ASCO|nr:hypothetical protein PORY_000965 [Pneumocystis oryctolagi]